MAEISSRIPNLGSMSEFINAFDVPSKMTDIIFKCRFSHLSNGIATRHSDTVDLKFFVDGRNALVGLAHTAFVEFQGRTGRALSDREASYVAAEYLRERLEQEDEHAVYDVSAADVTRLIANLGIA